jgi:hypothetical protein
VNRSASAGLASMRHILLFPGVFQVTGHLGRWDRAATRRPNPKEEQMSVVVVRQKVKDESVQAAQAAARELFATQRWVDGPPVIEHLEVVGSYHLFGTQPQELRR